MTAAVAAQRVASTAAPSIPAPQGSRRVLLLCIAALYTGAGIAVMLWLSPKVPYADGWRFLTQLALQPFPASILQADNGHREVLPNLLRLIELRWFGAGQWLQVSLGAALALATITVLARSAGRLDAERRAAWLCALALSLFWLGNQRTLAHGNESVHAYLVTLCLAIGIVLLQRGTTVATTLAAVAAAVASFSFGTGIACFAALALAAWLHRHCIRHWAILAIAAALTATAYLAGNAGSSVLQIAPLEQAALLLRWLAAPFAYALLPLVDLQVAEQIPTALGPVVRALAGHWQALWGPWSIVRWPWVGIGLLGVAAFLLQLLRARRATAPVPAMVIGLGLSAFALTVGALVVMARTDYFLHQHPDQVMASRYLVWSSLFWGGLLLASIGGPGTTGRTARFVALLAVLLLPSQLWMAELAARMRDAAGHGAVMAAVERIEPSAALGETDPLDLAAAIPALRSQHASAFGWPETRALGTVPRNAQPVVTAAWQQQSAETLDGATATRLVFQADVAATRLLILNDAGMAVGLAIPDRRRSGHWIGWARTEAGVPLQAAVLERE